MIATDIDAIVQQALNETLGPFGFERADVHSYVDHAGDDALSIVAYFKSSAPPLAERPSARAMGALRKTLLENGEERFPYLSFFVPEERMLPDDAATAE